MLSSLITIDDEALEMEKEAHKDNMVALKKKLKDAVDESLKDVFDTFKNVCDQVGVLCFCIQIPHKRINTEKVVIDWDIVTNMKRMRYDIFSI